MLDYGQTVFTAQLVVEPPQDKRRAFDVFELPVAVQIDAVELYVRMDMRLVRMRRHDKLVLPVGEPHRQLVADAVGLLRRDLPGLEGLQDAVHDDLPRLRLTAPGKHTI